MTGDSLRIKLRIDTVQYLADTACIDLLAKIKAKYRKTILIIGHSNTVSYIIHKLGGADLVVKDIPETEFDNLFLLRLKKRKVKLEALKYGETSEIKKL